MMEYLEGGGFPVGDVVQELHRSLLGTLVVGALGRLQIE